MGGRVLARRRLIRVRLGLAGFALLAGFQRYSPRELALPLDFLTRDLELLRAEAARLGDAPADPSAP